MTSEDTLSFYVSLLATTITSYGGSRHRLDRGWLTGSQVVLEPSRLVHPQILHRLDGGHVHLLNVVEGVVGQCAQG